jgi:hypothetical protein
MLDLDTSQNKENSFCAGDFQWVWNGRLASSFRFVIIFFDFKYDHIFVIIFFPFFFDHVFVIILKAKFFDHKLKGNQECPKNPDT